MAKGADPELPKTSRAFEGISVSQNPPGERRTMHADGQPARSTTGVVVVVGVDSRIRGPVPPQRTLLLIFITTTFQTV